MYRMLQVLPGGDAEGCQVVSASGDLWICLVSSNRRQLVSRVSRGSESFLLILPPENSNRGQPQMLKRRDSR